MTILSIREKNRLRPVKKLQLLMFQFTINDLRTKSLRVKEPLQLSYSLSFVMILTIILYARRTWSLRIKINPKYATGTITIIII